MNILLLNPNLSKKRNVGHHLFKKEISKQHNVMNYGKGYSNFNPNLSVQKIIKKHCKVQPDIILTYFWKFWQNIKGLDSIDIPKVHYVIDYTEKHHHYEQQTQVLLRDKHDLIFAPNTRTCDLLKKNNISNNIIRLPFSVDINSFKKISTIKKENIIMACFQDREDFYPGRKEIKSISETFGYRLITNATFQQYINAINRCKVSITHTDIFGSFNMKYTEILACGGFLLTNKPNEMDEFGYIDKKHFVVYNDLKDFETKLKYYMNPKHDSEREKIERNGMKFVRKEHNNKIRVAQMTKAIKDIFNTK
jgi:spore maturation protein CgeB